MRPGRRGGVDIVDVDWHAPNLLPGNNLQEQLRSRPTLACLRSSRNVIVADLLCNRVNDGHIGVLGTVAVLVNVPLVHIYVPQALAWVLQ